MSIVEYNHKKKGTFSYDVTEYKIVNFLRKGSGYLRYIGKSNKPTQPIGLKDYTGLFMLVEDLETLDLSDWDVSEVESIDFMFLKCTKLKEIVGIEEWNVSNIKHSNSAFLGSALSKYPTWYIDRM